MRACICVCVKIIYIPILLSSRTTIIHLLYTDDISQYAKNEQDIDLLSHLIWIYSKDIEV